MSVKIRLTRTGAKHRPFYRIVVTDSRMPRDGRFIATLGTYDPLSESGNIVVDGDQVKAWMEKGARPSVAVKQLLKKAGVVSVAAPAAAPIEKPSGAVSLEDLREREEEAAGGGFVEAAPEGEPGEEASAKKKVQAKPRKPAAKGAAKKKKAVKPNSK